MTLQSYRVNKQIRAPQVRVIGHDGSQIGVIGVEEARRRADEAGLDLVEVSPTTEPPVCRIMDYGKFKYEQRKKDRGGKKSHAGSLKELRVRPAIDAHDLAYRIDQGKRFLEEGHKVQVVCVFRGRQIAHPELGRAVLEQVMRQLGEVGKVEGSPRLMGNRMNVLIVKK